MSTALRIIILVVEILAYILIFFLKFRHLKRNSTYAIKENINYVITAKTPETIAIAETTVSWIIMSGLVFLIYPDHIFLSYKKIASIAGFVIINFFYFLNFKLEKDLFKRKTSTKAYILILFFVLIYLIVAPNTEKLFNPKKIVDYDFEHYVYLVDEGLKPIGNGKIAEIVDKEGETTSYFFIVEDEDGNEVVEVVDKLNLFSCIDIPPYGMPYIEKYVEINKYTYPELRVDEAKEEVQVTYRFHINSEVITQIQM